MTISDSTLRTSITEFNRQKERDRERKREREEYLESERIGKKMKSSV